jgi:hypothetical protein
LSRWLLWNGSDFAAEAPIDVTDPASTGCAPVIEANVHSIKYVPRFKTYLALIVRRGEVLATASPDLVRWSRPRRLLEAVQPAEWTPGDPAPATYFSLLDPDSADANFDALDDHAYLYFVRFQLGGGKVLNHRRDLMRIPVDLTADPAP